MKARDLKKIMESGKKPLVRLTGNIWDDSWGEKGMIARILYFTDKTDGLIEFEFDYNENKTHNLSLQSHSYYLKNNGMGTAFEAGLMTEDNIHEDLIAVIEGHGSEDEIPIELIDNGLLNEYSESGEEKITYVEWLEKKIIKLENQINKV